MTEKQMAFEILGKRKRIVGLIFKRERYSFALKMLDTGEVREVDVEWHNYVQFNVGDQITIPMFSFDKIHWFVERESALRFHYETQLKHENNF